MASIHIVEAVIANEHHRMTEHERKHSHHAAHDNHHHDHPPRPSPVDERSTPGQDNDGTNENGGGVGNMDGVMASPRIDIASIASLVSSTTNNSSSSTADPHSHHPPTLLLTSPSSSASSEHHTPKLGSAALKILRLHHAHTLVTKSLQNKTPWLPKSNIPRILWYSRLRHQINSLFSDVESRGGILTIVLIALVIVLSVISFCISTLPEYRLRKLQGIRGSEEDAFDLIENICVAIFTIEYLIRLVTWTAVPTIEEDTMFTVYREWEQRHTDEHGHPLPNAPLPPPLPVVYTRQPTDKISRSYISAATVERSIVQILKFALSPLNIIDVVAVAPFYYSLNHESATDGSITILRVLRLSRVLRLFRLSHRNHGYRLLMRTLVNSADALFMLFYLITLGVILFGSILFYCESGDWDDTLQTWVRPDTIGSGVEESPFRSIPVSFWWAVVTMATVGYGDFYPTTAAGRAMGSVVIVFGLITIALPITIIGSNFSDEYARYRLEIQLGGDGFSKTMDELESIEADMNKNRSSRRNSDSNDSNNHNSSKPISMGSLLTNTTTNTTTKTDPPSTTDNTTNSPKLDINKTPLISAFFFQDPVINGSGRTSPTKNPPSSITLPGTVATESPNGKVSVVTAATVSSSSSSASTSTTSTTAIDELRKELTNEISLLRKDNEMLRNQLDTIVNLLQKP